MDKVHECVALLSSENAMVVRCGFGLGVFSLKMCSKPETPQQRKDRERLESAYDLYCEYTNASSCDAKCYSSHAFSNLLVKDKWLAIVDKTNYRKEKTHGTN